MITYIIISILAFGVLAFLVNHLAGRVTRLEDEIKNVRSLATEQKDSEAEEAKVFS